MIKTGLVIKSTGSWYKVKNQENCWNCKIKGKIKLKGLKTTNPIAVGDKVDFEIIKEENIGIISKIYPRKNYIIRKSTNLSRQGHIIAANIDQTILIVTLKSPQTDLKFIDRYLVVAESYNVPVVIIFNKIDIYQEQENILLENLLLTYRNIAYKCLKISVWDNINIDAVKLILKDKLSLISGNSGVGKSSLINKLQKNLNLKVDSISEYHNKGKHTTTFAEMHELDFGAKIIDTPGIKGFGMLDMKQEDIAHNFREIFALLQNCKYYNCTHVHEPECAVKIAVKEGLISESRYNNYCSLILEQDEKYRNDKYF